MLYTAILCNGRGLCNRIYYKKPKRQQYGWFISVWTATRWVRQNKSFDNTSNSRPYTHWRHPILRSPDKSINRPDHPSSTNSTCYHRTSKIRTSSGTFARRTETTWCRSSTPMWRCRAESTRRHRSMRLPRLTDTCCRHSREHCSSSS